MHIISLKVGVFLVLFKLFYDLIKIKWLFVLKVHFLILRQVTSCCKIQNIAVVKRNRRSFVPQAAGGVRLLRHQVLQGVGLIYIFRGWKDYHRLPVVLDINLFHGPALLHLLDNRCGRAWLVYPRWQVYWTSLKNSWVGRRNKTGINGFVRKLS